MGGRQLASIGMAEIATVAGVSLSTVSRALSGAVGVSTQQRIRILQIARERGYVTDDFGTSPQRRPALARARIAAVVPDLDRWVFGSILAGLQDVLVEAGPILSVLQGSSAADRERILLSYATPRSCDALILVPLPARFTAEEVGRLPVPVVVAGTVVPGLSSVGVDDVAIGERATNYLINIGCREIAYVSNVESDGLLGRASADREAGFRASMLRAGLDPSWTIHLPLGERASRRAGEELLQRTHLPDAVAASSDELAAGIMSVLRRAGVRIPEDVAVIGVDDHPMAQVLQLTTIAQPARQQGQLAARLAIAALTGVARVETHTLSTRLVVRDSTCWGGRAR